MEYVDMSEIRRAARGHWFDPSSMRFFRSRVGSTAYRTADGSRAYFVSSEQFEDGRGYRADRRYTVRVIDLATGDIDTVGDFQAYASRSGADRAAQRLASMA
jgi:hypothetical protein